MSRRLTDTQRADLIGGAVASLHSAQKALSAAQCPLVAAKVGSLLKAAQEAYRLASGRERHEIRCVHGTLLSVTCRACHAQAEGAPTRA